MTVVPFWLLFFLLNLPLYVLAVWRIGWPFAIRTFMAVSLVSLFSRSMGAWVVSGVLRPRP